MKISFCISRSLAGIDKAQYELFHLTQATDRSDLKTNNQYKSVIIVPIDETLITTGFTRYDAVCKDIASAFNNCSSRLSNVLVTADLELELLIKGVAHGFAQGMEIPEVYQISTFSQNESILKSYEAISIRIKDIIANAVRSSAMY